MHGHRQFSCCARYSGSVLAAFLCLGTLSCEDRSALEPAPQATRTAPEPKKPRPAPVVIARVGTATITQLMLERQLKVNQARGAKETESKLALRSLVELLRYALEDQVARRHGQGPTEQDLLNVAKHARTTSRAPKLLAAIRQVFGGDAAAYRRQILAPRVTSAKGYS